MKATTGTTRATGAAGEDIAEKFLFTKGYEILRRNYRNKFGEIDIVAKKDGEIVFAEVKTRKSESFGEPQESVTESKLRKLRRMANFFMSEKRANPEMSFRIDVISIKLGSRGEVKEIKHLENV